jgi:hypothetical protein
MFNRKLMNITTQNVESANGITIQNNVLIHIVPDGIVGAWWTNPVPHLCVLCDMTTNPSVVMSRLPVMAPTETVTRSGLKDD